MRLHILPPGFEAPPPADLVSNSVHCLLGAVEPVTSGPIPCPRHLSCHSTGAYACWQVLTAEADGSAMHPLRHAAMAVSAAVAQRDVRLWPAAVAAATASTPDAAASCARVDDACQQSMSECTANSIGSAARGCLSGASGMRKQARVEPSTDVHESLRISAAAAADPASASAAQLPPPQPKLVACRAGDDCAQLAVAQPKRSEQCADPDAGNHDSDRVSTVPSEQHPPANPAQPAPGLSSGAGPKSYLCTGFDCYLIREPCVMCAMALVHSRVRRVIYAEADPEHGALGGALRLHSQRSLNHHYKVYHMARTG